MRCKCKHHRDSHKEDGRCVVLGCDCKQFNKEFHNTPTKPNQN